MFAGAGETRVGASVLVWVGFGVEVVWVVECGAGLRDVEREEHVEELASEDEWAIMRSTASISVSSIARIGSSTKRSSTAGSGVEAEGVSSATA